MLRAYMPADAESLMEVYRNAALTLGRQEYTEEQTRVWALYPEDVEEFRDALSEGLTVCAVDDGSPVAFGQLDPPDHITYLYCHSAYARRGYASAIYTRLEDYARSNRVSTVRVEASCVARPFFERFGYHVVEAEHPVRHGVAFLRFKMTKELAKQ